MLDHMASLALRNPHRLYEDPPVAVAAIGAGTAELLLDFISVILHCLNKRAGSTRDRRNDFQMNPEGFGLPEHATARDILKHAL
mgnify:CR=1 FL=1